MFARLIKNLCETESINSRKRKTRTDEAAEVAILGAVKNNPHLSTRQIESYSGISKRSLHHIVTPGTLWERFKNHVQFVNEHSNNCRHQTFFPKCSFCC
jgi:hypothetical protein